MSKEKIHEEKILHPASGYAMLFVGLVGVLIGVALMILGPILGSPNGNGWLIGGGIAFL